MRLKKYFWQYICQLEIVSDDIFHQTLLLRKFLQCVYQVKNLFHCFFSDVDLLKLWKVFKHTINPTFLYIFPFFSDLWSNWKSSTCLFESNLFDMILSLSRTQWHSQCVLLRRFFSQPKGKWLIFGQ